MGNLMTIHGAAYLIKDPLCIYVCVKFGSYYINKYEQYKMIFMYINSTLLLQNFKINQTI